MTTGSQSRTPRPATPQPVPQRRQARSNRARLLAAARTELSQDPDVSLDEIARAAGVVRRTLYGHFPSREALIDALAAEAEESLEEAFTSARRPDTNPATALARLILASWGVGDHYAMLISLARRRLGEDRLRAILESQASSGPESWSDPTGEAAATAVLITAGVEPAAARRYVQAALRPGR